MNYEQFVHDIFECTKTKVFPWGIVEKQEIVKNNGVVAIGLTIRRMESNLAPIIYLEGIYNYFLQGESLEDLADFLIENSRKISNVHKINYKEFLEFPKIREHIVYKLVNAKRNEKLLGDIPHLPLFDLAIVFYWIVPTGEGEYGSVLIKNSHMNLWKLPVSVLYECAKENTKKIFPYMFRPLNEYVNDTAGISLEKSPLYILSNTEGIFGASAILYPEMPGKIYKILGEKYYLLPSSVHEFLIVPENRLVHPKNLKAMVKEVNETQIVEEELLSDNVYYFDGDIITKM